MHYELALLLGEGILLEIVSEVASSYVVHDQVDVLRTFIYFSYLNHILMINTASNCDFLSEVILKLPRHILLRDDFDGDCLLGSTVPASVHLGVATFSHLYYLLVFIFEYEMFGLRLQSIDPIDYNLARLVMEDLQWIFDGLISEDAEAMHSVNDWQLLD